MGLITRAAAQVEEHLSIVLAIAGAALIALPPIVGQAGLATISAVIGGCLLTGYAGYREIRQRKDEAKNLHAETAAVQQTLDAAKSDLEAVEDELDQARAAGAAEQMTLINNLLPRALEKLSSYHGATRAPDKEAAYKLLVADVLGRIGGRYGTDQPASVNYYRLMNDAQGVHLQVVEHTSSVRRERLDRTTPEGDLILTRVLGGDDVYCPDLHDPEQAKQHLAEPERERAYRCFTSVVVRAGNTGFGMLSANTRDAHGLPPTSVELLALFGSIMASAEITRSDTGLYVAQLEGHDVLRPG